MTAREHNRQGGAVENALVRDGVFRAVLTPYRSLSPTGFLILMSLIGGVSFIVGLTFLSMGAWPVMGFFGLDVLLIYIAFKLNYRSGLAYETVELSPRQLLLTKYDPSGRAEKFEFNPYWAKFLLSEGVDGRSVMSLISHGRQVIFGQFLSEDERRDFGRVFEMALAKAKSARGYL